MADAGAVSAVVTAVKGNAAVDEISYGKELVARLIAMTRALRLGILALAGLLGFATLFLVQNSVRLSVFARRDEISIMRLVGATDGVIRLPFVFEGMALASWGAIVAAIAVSIGYTWLTRTFGRSMAFVPVLPAFSVLSSMVPLLIVLGALIGAVGATFALRRWLRE
jgi:cell division transport system permease protein